VGYWDSRKVLDGNGLNGGESEVRRKRI